MWNPTTLEVMPGFWPPKPNPFWRVALAPVRHYYLRNFYGISHIELLNREVLQNISPQDGVLIAPNHSHDSDPHVIMDVSRQLKRQLYFMAAWQVFKMHGGIDGWVMQRFGAYSVDREGCDRRAIRQTVELLTSGQWLVIFPEGEIYHTNERLTPLRDGVAFMAVTAQRDLEQHHVWVVPTAIRYRYDQDITPQLQEAAAEMEKRFMISPPSNATLPQRIVHLGEVLLTIKEKEILGHSQENLGELPNRLNHFIATILEKEEQLHLKKVTTDTIPLRVKNLRRHVLEQMAEPTATEPDRQTAAATLEHLHLVLQLYSYPGDYITTNPSIERMAETIEKFEEDLNGIAFPKGKRRAIVKFGQPIDVKPLAALRPRAATTELTATLEHSLTELMSGLGLFTQGSSRQS